MNQTPSTKQGNFYVTVIRGSRVALLLGPFENDHAAALRMVEPVRKEAEARDPFMVFDAFGTTGYFDGTNKPGALNAAFGLSTGAA